MKKFIIIDANALIHRAFHALPPLTNRDGLLVNAVYGFITIFLKVLKDLKPDYITCCFDVSKDTFRKKEYSAYKAKRVKQPQELYDQIALVKQVLDAFQVQIYEKEGFEADDLIGTLVNLNNDKQVKNIIVTGDLDTLQLINDNTEVYTLKKGISETVIYNRDAVEERYGFGPEKIVDFRALKGDQSDNIPGVRGIGEKTAQDLIRNFGSLEKIYQYLDNKNDSIRNKSKLINDAVINKLEVSKEDAYLSQKLSLIVKDVPINFRLQDCQIKSFNTPKVVKLFQNFNFNSLIARIPQAEKIMLEKQGTLFQKKLNNTHNNEAKNKFVLKAGYHLINSDDEFEIFLSELLKQKVFAFDTETDGLNPFKNKLLGISFSWKKNEAWYLPVQRIKKQDLRINKIFEDKSFKKIGHNLKFDYEVLSSFGINTAGLYFDTMIASYLLNPGTRQHSLDNLAFVELGYRTQTIEELSGTTKTKEIDLSLIDLEKVANYSCEDSDVTWQLYLKLSEKLDEVLIEEVLEKIEMPLIPVLADMEHSGIKLDIKFLNKMGSEIFLNIKSLESKIYEIAGYEFNVASPLQLKEVLFEKLKISTRGLSRIKTGISTAAEQLEKLRGRHKIIDLIIDFRELSKLKNTYLDPLPNLVDENQRVHTSFNQTITATGRLSSSDPNLQNIPIRTELGKKVRQAFIAEKGYWILAADYSQIELRIIASLAQDEEMLEAFYKNRDIHTETASRIFDVPVKKVTPNQRRQAKAVNFGVIYGLGPRGLAQGAGITLEEAQIFIEKYFEVYAGIKSYIEETISKTRENGYAETIFKRRRYLPDINTHHQQLRAQAERMAINHPIQGTAADLIKIAMINIHSELRRKFTVDDARMLLQVHDELVLEVKDKFLSQVEEIVEREMREAYRLAAPIKISISHGSNWGECK